MSYKKRFYFILLNRKLFFFIVLFFILVSLSTINFTASQRIESVIYRPEDNIYYEGKQDDIAFKINVAWGEEHIPKMLEILAENKIKATFFFVGSWVEKFPDELRKIKAAGHEIGNHGYRHYHPKKLSQEELIDLIQENERLIEQEINYKTELFAAPYGEVNDEIVKTASSLGYKTIMWTIDTIDWQRPAPNIILNRVTDNLQPGAIILMHPTKVTVEALPEMIKAIQEKRYDIIPVSELIRGG